MPRLSKHPRLAIHKESRPPTQMRELERRARAMAEPLRREGEAQLRAEFEPQIRAMERQF